MARWFALVLVAWHPLPAFGQAVNAAALPVDSLVRLRTAEFRPNRFAEHTLLTGTLQSWGDDTLRLLVSQARPADRVPLGQVARVPLIAVRWLEMRRGHRRAWREGAIIGAVVGGIVGFVVAANECSSSPCLIHPAPFVGMAVGAGAGSLLGSPFRVERWQEVPLERMRAP